jgi:predicted dehydrogenase
MKKTQLHLVFILLIALFASCCNKSQTPVIDGYSVVDGLITLDVPEREAGQTSVLQLALPPIEEVKIAFIGLGMRGSDAVRRYTYIDGVKTVALCDLLPEYVERSQKTLEEAGLPEAKEYVGPEAYKELFENEDIDLAYICTDWLGHVPIAVCAMEHGVNVAIEVPAATTIDECWQLVNTAEKTQKHCMMLENCCYDFFEMATMAMNDDDLFGEIVHVEGAYIHDLRWLQFDEENGYVGMWRLEYNKTHNGNHYCTHGLGPLAQILDIHRGDRMEYIVSVSSDQFGMTEYAKQKFGEDSDYAKYDYALGDMSTSIIKTAKGKTIMLQHDVTSPRPYNRHHLISGTKGFAQKYPVESLAFEPNAHSALPEEEMKEVLAKYEHRITKEIGEIAREVGGHGGMDFIMDYRLIYCLHNGLPLDQDVYDAAEWSCIGELSEISVNHKGMPVAIPDFTRGDWNKTNGYKHAFAK